MYGPYLPLRISISASSSNFLMCFFAYKGNNYKIPKDVVPVDLNYQTCLEIIKLQSEKAENAPKRGRYAKKK